MKKYYNAPLTERVVLYGSKVMGDPYDELYDDPSSFGDTTHVSPN